MVLESWWCQSDHVYKNEYIPYFPYIKGLSTRCVFLDGHSHWPWVSAYGSVDCSWFTCEAAMSLWVSGKKLHSYIAPEVADSNSTRNRTVSGYLLTTVVCLNKRFHSMWFPLRLSVKFQPLPVSHNRSLKVMPEILHLVHISISILHVHGKTMVRRIGWLMILWMRKRHLVSWICHVPYFAE